MTNIDDIKLASQDIAFARKNGEVVFPEYAARENLVLWYDFLGRKNSDAQKGVAEDLSGNGNHGTLNGFAYIGGSGYENSALRFEGIDDYISITCNRTSFSSFSGEIVFKIHGFNTNIGSYYAVSTVATATYMMIRNTSSKLLFFSFLLNKTQQTFATSLPIVVGVTYFIYYSYDGNMIKVFNGLNLIASIPAQGELGADTSFYQIGKYANSMSYLDGSIYSYRLHDKALTASEIAQNYAIDQKRFNII